MLAVALPAAPAAAHGVEGAITHRDTREELAFVDVAATAAAAAAPGALPYEWCGEARTTDDLAHDALPASSPRFKLVYAHPADRPDRFDGWRNAIQGNVALIQRFLASQSGGAKAARIDMGTSCGPQFVDIQVVHLSGLRSQYVDNFSAIVNEVEPRLGTASGPRNVVILADTLNGIGYDYGLGENVLSSAGDRRGAGNVHNYGGFASVLFTRDGQPAPGAAARELVGGGLPARDEPQPRGRAVVRAAQHAAARLHVLALRPLLAGRGHHVLHGGRLGRARRCSTTVRASAARSRRPTTAAATTTSTPPRRPAATSPATGTCTTARSSRRATRSPPPAAAAATDSPRRRLSATAAPGLSGSPRRGAQVGALAGAWRNGPLTFDYRWQRHVRGRWRSIARATKASLCPEAHRPRPPAARPGRRHQPARQRIRGLGAQRAGGRPQARPPADPHQQAVPR